MMVSIHSFIRRTRGARGSRILNTSQRDINLVYDLCILLLIDWHFPKIPKSSQIVHISVGYVVSISGWSTDGTVLAQTLHMREIT